jgi:drug/metabolite transporter (DMT)-like permease
MLYQIISLIGAVMILAAYAGNQRGWMDRRSLWYNLLNLVGSAFLAWVAILDRRLGFIFLESAWALLSIPPLLTARRSRGV